MNDLSRIAFVLSVWGCGLTCGVAQVESAFAAAAAQSDDAKKKKADATATAPESLFDAAAAQSNDAKKKADAVAPAMPASSGVDVIISGRPVPPPKNRKSPTGGPFITPTPDILKLCQERSETKGSAEVENPICKLFVK